MFYKSNEPAGGKLLQEFAGLNERKKISSNEFARMENMSLKQYPLLTVREKRLTLSRENGCVCMWHRGSLVKIVNDTGKYVLYVDGKAYTSVKLTDEGDKKIIGMGAYVLIMPDKIYVNTAGPRVDLGVAGQITWGYVDATASGWATFMPCSLDGTTPKFIQKDVPKVEEGDVWCDTSTNPVTYKEYCPFIVDGEPWALLTYEYDEPKFICKTDPSKVIGGDVWLDTSGDTYIYKIWDENLEEWSSLGSTYINIKIDKPEISGRFADYDAAKFVAGEDILDLTDEQITGKLEEKIKEQLAQFASMDASSIIFKTFNDEGSLVFVVAGMIDRPFKAHLNVTRRMPEFDFLFEHNNRMWGCVFSKPKYLIFSGKNEIVASRQGDLKNWQAYLGVSSDSYAATVGAPGEFTGGASYGGYPIFFKEDYIIKVYGDLPSSYQILATPAMGVEKGMHESIVVADNLLFYKSPSCFCAYDGNVPVNISSKLKNKKYASIRSGATDDRVFFACEEQNGERYMLVFDIESGVWTKEECGKISGFIKQGASLNFTECDSDGFIDSVKSIGEDYDEELVQTEDTEGQVYPLKEADVSWFCESGDITVQTNRLTYIRKITAKVKLDAGASVKALLSCDGGEFRQVGNKIISPGMVTMAVAVVPERCESFRYRLEGNGYVEIHGIVYEVKEGSDKR
jgi:hypothetical protein